MKLRYAAMAAKVCAEMVNSRRKALQDPCDAQPNWDDSVAIGKVLLSHGDVFSGGRDRVWYVAVDWCKLQFDAETVDSWCGVGVWEPSVAADLRAAGISPRQAAERARALVAKVRDAGGDPARTYTDGCPIYSVCNNDTGISVLLCDNGDND